LRPTDEFYNRPSNIATTSLFNAIDREAKELPPRSIFIITRRYERVKIQRYNRRVVA
jgi:hypothetical protein